MPYLDGRHHIAIVDGSAAHREQVTAALKSFYHFADYYSAATAFAGMLTVRPAFVLVGEAVPPGSGYDFIRRLRDDPELSGVPAMLVIGQDNPDTLAAVAECGANGYLVKPYRRSQLIRSLSDMLNRECEARWEDLPEIHRKALTQTVEVFNSISDVIERGEPIAYNNVRDACEPLVEAVRNNDFREILSGVKDHDNYSYSHSLRVATLLSLFGFTIGLSTDEQSVLASGGLLHDVGKMSIPHEVLNKPGRLTSEEFLVMKNHVTASVSYLSRCHDLPKGIEVIAGQHHEKLDGTGYPLGLVGNQLNRLARMAAIVDVFGALTDRRIYKPPMEAEEALKMMADMPGHLDKELLKMFREMLLDAASEISI
jgi:putative nucleotidyltransferase with HDIG domain